MRIDIEQFLALTVVLGSVSAVGVAAYTMRDEIAEEVGAVAGDAEESLDLEAQEPVAEALPPIPVVPAAPAAPVPPPAEEVADDASFGGDDAIAGPDVEVPSW